MGGTGMSELPEEQGTPTRHADHNFINHIVRLFLHSNLPIVLILLATALGLAALWATPREEDPQIIVPLADIHVSFPGYSAAEVERLVSTPLEKLLYEIDGVEYVYSMSREDGATITVRFHVGEDRERSLVKIFKRIDENLDLAPPGVTGWIVKPVEIDDVPIVTFALAMRDDRVSDAHALRRVAEELAPRFSVIREVSRVNLIGGESRAITIELDPDRLQAYRISIGEIQEALRQANARVTAGEFSRQDRRVRVTVDGTLRSVRQVSEIVVGVNADQPIRIADVASLRDGPAELDSYVRHGWGAAAGRAHDAAGGSPLHGGDAGMAGTASRPAVTIAVAKKKGTNAVWVARDVLSRARELSREIVPDDMQLVVTRNYGLTADHKVTELIEGLGVAILIVLALLTFGLGWREALIVCLAVPVVFGLTLTVNWLSGYTINRVTLFALILSLGLLVDDPIVDVENIARHFAMRRKRTREIVLEAVAEIRPPLITATLAVVVSFLPMFFITGMMGPYMRPMALNVPVAMLMSMVVAFTLTPWLTYHVLKRGGSKQSGAEGSESERFVHDTPPIEKVQRSVLYRAVRPLLGPLLRSRAAAWGFLGGMLLLMLGAAGLAAMRAVPLKMLPFDNKNELLLVLDFPEGTTLERANAAVEEFEAHLSTVPEIVDVTSYVGVASPMDFNGLVRHYYLRRGPSVAEIRLNLVDKKDRAQQSHAIGLRLRNSLTALAERFDASLKIVETPPGPPVIASIVAEVYGRPEHSYAELCSAAETVRERMRREPGVVDLDDVIEAEQRRLVFIPDQEKAALNGVSLRQIGETLAAALNGAVVETLRDADERQPLPILVRLPRFARSGATDLGRLYVKGAVGQFVPLAELGAWEERRVDQTIYHKNMERVVYVFAETAGRPPAECVVDIQSDFRALTEYEHGKQMPVGVRVGAGAVLDRVPRGLSQRSYLSNGGGIEWMLPAGFRVDWAGEGEWKITIDVFRDLGLAFAAALVGIYILLVAQTGSFVLPLVVMLAIPLTVIGIMPGFWLLNAIVGDTVGGFADSVFFTATAMIGMIALAGIVTRNSIILLDFIELSLSAGRPRFDAVIEACVVRLRPILLTAGTAMLSALPIVIDPIFSGLAWALIFGLFASTVFTLFVIPIVYWLLYADRSRDLRGA